MDFTLSDSRYAFVRLLYSNMILFLGEGYQKCTLTRLILLMGGR